MDDEKAHEERHEVQNCSDASFEPPWRRAVSGSVCEIVLGQSGSYVAEREVEME